MEGLLAVTKVDYGTDIFLKGFNCAQSVFSAFSEDYGLDVVTARKIAGGLGGGARTAELCGAVSGAVLVIGLKHGQGASADAAMKLKCNAETEDFMCRFRAANEDIVCRHLLGCDISTVSGREVALEKGLFTTKCKDLVGSAIGILIEMGY